MDFKVGEGCKVGQFYCPDGEGVASLKAVTSQGFQGGNQLSRRAVVTLTVHQSHGGSCVQTEGSRHSGARPRDPSDLVKAPQ